MAKASKLSKMAANRLAISATVTSSFQVHGNEIGSALHARLFPDGGVRSDTTLRMLEALSGCMERAASEVQAADLAHAAELLDDEAPRQQRDSAHVLLTSTLLGMRETMSALYGPAVAAAYGLAEALPSQTEQLLQRGRVVAGLLRKLPLSAKPLRATLSCKPSVLADELEPLIEALDAALAEVRRETREAQLTVERKAQAAETWQSTYQAVTSVFHGLFLLAGRRDLAERIEPTWRRRAGLPDPSDPNIPAPPSDPDNPTLATPDSPTPTIQ